MYYYVVGADEGLLHKFLYWLFNVALNSHNLPVDFPGQMSDTGYHPAGEGCALVVRRPWVYQSNTMT